MPEVVFNVVAEYPEKKHIEENMRPTVMHKHCREQRQVDRIRARSFRDGRLNYSAGLWIANGLGIGYRLIPHKVFAGDDLFGNDRIAICEIQALLSPFCLL